MKSPILWATTSRTASLHGTMLLRREEFTAVRPKVCFAVSVQLTPKEQQVLDLIETAHQEAWQILTDNREILDELVRRLLVKQTLNEKELKEVFADIKMAPERPVWLSSPNRPDSDVPPVPIPESLKESAGIPQQQF